MHAHAISSPDHRPTALCHLSPPGRPLIAVAMMAHGSRLFLLLEALLFSALLLLPARPSAADGSGSTSYPADCPYPCLPPPTAPAVVTNCPPPPAAPSSTYSYPPPPAPSSYNTPPSSSWSYPPPPPGGYIPYFQPPAGGGGGGGGYGYPAPPPPNPILPWYPWYYKTPPSSAAVTLARGGSSVLSLLAAVLAAGLLIMA